MAYFLPIPNQAYYYIPCRGFNRKKNDLVYGKSGVRTHDSRSDLSTMFLRQILWLNFGCTSKLHLSTKKDVESIKLLYLQVGTGLINPRVKDPNEDGSHPPATDPRSGVPDIAIRIVNNVSSHYTNPYLSTVYC